VVLSCEEGVSLGKILEDNKAWFDRLFSERFPWNDSFVATERIAWVRCRASRYSCGVINVSSLSALW